MQSDHDLTAGRKDIYGPVHKGLRHAHALMLQRISAADFAVDTTALIRDVRRHLALAATHLADEEAFVHTALERRVPGATERLDKQHRNHREHLGALEKTLLQIEGGERTCFAGRRLYHQFISFVADDLDHMAEEEFVCFPLLCQHFSDEELAAIEYAIVQSLSPDMANAFAEIMLAAGNVHERAALLDKLRASMPSSAYEQLFRSVVAPASTGADLERFRALGLAA